tara:strand:- start:89 stop:274 length:186 start_codon:yes stop_codon:yes gene_type:complete
MYQICEKPIHLTQQCMTENGIESDEKFTIKDIVGNFEQLIIVNQYDQNITINPNQIINESN